MSPYAVKKPPRDYSKSGLYKLKGAIKTLGKRAIDQRTTVAKVLAQWRVDLVNDLGGPGSVSKQQIVIVDLAVKTHLILESLDNWLLQQNRLINTRSKSVFPVVRERQQLADSLARYMTMLGLEKRKKALPALNEYIAEKYPSEEKSAKGRRTG
jgi:hypothetical protein